MITRDEAIERVLAALRARAVGGADGVVILESKTIEKPYGWAFFYNSRKFIETGELLYCLVGGGPVVVLADTGAIHELGSARPPLEEIAKLEQRLGLTV
jgi:hypothetical protein